MRSTALPLLLMSTALAGCATAPDGSRIQRMPQTEVAPALTGEEARKLAELNASILADQERARQREEAAAARRERDTRLYWGLGYGRGWHDDRAHWLWNGHRWVWRPRWGVELWGPWAY